RRPPAGAGRAGPSGPAVIGSLPGWLGRLTSPTAKTFGIGIPPVVAIWIVVAIVVGVSLRRMVTGRRIYAAGANRPGAALARVPVGGVWALALASRALASAMTGVLLAGFSGGGDASVGNPYLFTTLTAVVVGGTAISGGRGGYWQTVLGAVILTELTTILVGKGYSQADQQILFGLIILAA